MQRQISADTRSFDVSVLQASDLDDLPSAPAGGKTRSCASLLGTPPCSLEQNQWAHIVFSDDSCFLLERHDGRLLVLHRPGERFVACLNPASDNLWVWQRSGMECKHRRPSDGSDHLRLNLPAVRSIQQALRRQILPFFQQHGPTGYVLPSRYHNIGPT